MSALHCHDHYEAYYLLEGTRTYFIGNRQYSVQAGDVVLISKRVLHKTTVQDTGAHSRITLYFTDDYIPDCLQKQVTKLFSFCVFTPENKEEVKQRFFDLLDAQKTEENFKDAWMKCRMFELFVSLNKSVETKKVADDFMTRTATYLKQHLSEPVTLPAVAEHFSFSISHFSRKFKEEAGVGFQEYLTILRTQLGAKLLEETDLTVTEIAGKCGFEDSNYFSTVFRRIYKTSPRTYRQSILNPKAGKETSPNTSSPDSKSR